MQSCEHLLHCLSLAVANSDANSTALWTFVSTALDPSVGVFASLSEVGCLNDQQRAALVESHGRIVDGLAELIRTEVRRSNFRDCDPLITARTLLSIILWTPMSNSWSRTLRSAAQNTDVTALIDLIQNGLGYVSPPDRPNYRVSFADFRPASGGAFDKAYLTAARREALLASASWLFNRKGVDATSLDEVAARAGATKRAVLHHFGDKQTLVEEAYKRGIELANYIPGRLSEVDLTPAEKLSSAFAAVAEANCRPELALATPRVSLDALRPEAKAELEHLSDELTGRYVELLTEAEAQREVQGVDVPGYLVLAAGAWQWLNQGLATVRPEDEVLVAHEISNFLMSGLVSRL